MEVPIVSLEKLTMFHILIFMISLVRNSLKKFQIELGINHKELGLPWDKPVPEELWTTGR